MKTSFFVWPIFLKFDLVFNTGVYQITKLSLMQGQIEEPGSFLTCLFVLNANEWGRKMINKLMNDESISFKDQAPIATRDNYCFIIPFSKKHIFSWVYSVK